jgi:hypothetical protein
MVPGMDGAADDGYRPRSHARLTVILVARGPCASETTRPSTSSVERDTETRRKRKSEVRSRKTRA